MIGAGSWGTTVENVSAHNQSTMIWAREQEVVDGINDRHENPLFLHVISLQDRLTASQDLGEVLDGADVEVVEVPSNLYRVEFRSERVCPTRTPGAELVHGHRAGHIQDDDPGAE